MSTEDPLGDSESRYDQSLNGEERSRIRKQRRESLLLEKNVSSPGAAGSRNRTLSCSSQGSSLCYRSHFSPGPLSPTSAETFYFPNQNWTSHHKGTTSSKESVPGQQVALSGATTVDRSDALSSTARARSLSDSTILDSHRNKPPLLSLAGSGRVSTTAFSLCSPLSLHSPAAIGKPSCLLSGVIARQQSREKSVSPFSRPLDKEKSSSSSTTPSCCRRPCIRQQDMEKSSSPPAALSWQHDSPISGREGVKFRLDKSAVHAETNSTKSVYMRSNLDQSKAANSAALEEAPTENQNGKHKISSSFTTSGIESTLNSFDFKPNSDLVLEHSGTLESAEDAYSRSSTQSPLSSGMIFAFDQPFSSTTLNSIATHSPSSFASSLTFVDTDVQPSLTGWEAAQEPSSIRGQIQKTNVVYGSHEDSSVTVVPSSGFFDPTQSQVDVLEKSVPDGRIANLGSRSGMEKKRDCSSTEGKEEIMISRSNGLPLGHLKSQHTSANITDRRGEEEVDSAIGNQDVVNGSLHNDKKERVIEKETKKRKLFGSKREEVAFHASRSAPVTDMHSFTLPPENIERNAKFSLSPFRKAQVTTYTLGTQTLLNGGGLSKLSMPNLSRPPAPCELMNRAATPENGYSDSSGRQNQGKKKSFAHRIINLVGGTNKGSAEKYANPVMLKNYKKLDVDLSSPPSDFSRSGSNVDIAIISPSNGTDGYSAASSVAEMRRSQSTSSLYTQMNNSKSGMMLSSAPRTKSSNSCSLVSDTSRKSSVNSADMKSSGSSASVKSADGTAKKKTLASSNLGPSIRGTTVSENISPRSCPSSTRKLETTGSPTKGSAVQGKISPRNSPSTTKKLTTTNSPTKGSAVQGRILPRSSPLASRKHATGTSKYSPNSKRNASFEEQCKYDMPGNGSKRFSNSGDREKGSPKHSAMKISPSKSSPLATRKTISTNPTNTTSSSSAGKASPKASPISGKKTVPLQRRESPTSSPIMARKPLHHGISSPRASPLLKRKIVASTSSSSREKSSPTKKMATVSSAEKSSPKVTSPLSSFKKSAGPPRLSKVDLDNDSEVEPSNQLSTFVRFSAVRKPIMVRSPDRSKHSSPVLKHIDLVTDIPLSASESSIVSSLDSASTHKKTETIACIDSPVHSPVASEAILGIPEQTPPRSDMVSESALNQDVDSLLASVEMKLGSLVTSESLSMDESMTSDIPEMPQSRSGLDGLCSPHSQRSTSLVDDSQDDKESGGVAVEASNVKINTKTTFGFNSRKKDTYPIKGKSAGKTVPLLSKKTPPEVRKNTSGLSRMSETSRSGQTFTTARPPRHPLPKESVLPKTSLSHNHKSPISTAGQTKAQIIAAARSGQPASMQKKTLTKSGSFELRKEEEDHDDSLKSVSGSDLIGKKSVESFQRRNSSLNKSMKFRGSSRIRPGSIKVVNAQQQQQQQQQGSVRTTGKPSMGQSNRRDVQGTKVSPGSASKFSRDKPASAAGTHASPSASRKWEKGSGGTAHGTTTKAKSTAIQKSNDVRGGPGNLKIIHSSATISAKVPIKSSVSIQRGENLRKSGKMGGDGGSTAPATRGDSSPTTSSSLRRKSLRGSQKRHEYAGEGLALHRNRTTPPADTSPFSPSRVNTLKRAGSRGSSKRKESTGEAVGMRRSSKVWVGSSPSASVADPLPPKGSLLRHMSSSASAKRKDSAEDAFDLISSQATTLVSSDHRRAVRPKSRQKASVSHLKILSSREGVTSDLVAHEETRTFDSNSYSTYLSKKVLAPSAMAGLAARVDFSTVKLRKTGTLQQEASDKAGCPIDKHSASLPSVTPGMEFNTVHPVMLLQIKGRRSVQTCLVEPSGTSLNSGDVFLLVTKTDLFHWVGKGANIIEKARASDISLRILHKKEVGCKASTINVLKEEECHRNSKKEDDFWKLIGGKKDVKSAESAPGDEVYVKAVHLATTVYRLEGDNKESVQFVSIQENSTKMMTIGLLQKEHIFLFDFYSEVYVWIGTQSPIAFRKKAMELGKQYFDMGCKPPAFAFRKNSPSHSSNRYRPRGSMRTPRHSITNAIGRKNSKGSKSDLCPRPPWALFARVTEGSEHILFREKFCDWPEVGRIIKMKGHVSSGEVQEKSPSEELQPADVEKMLKNVIPFDGLRLDGDNIHRGQGNFKISNSSFSRNRTRTIEVKKWVIKEFDNIVVPHLTQDLFYTSESYVIRWEFQLMVVRELEGLSLGQGILSCGHSYKRSQQKANEGKTPPMTEEAQDATTAGAESDSDSSLGEEEGEEEKRMLESGGRDRCAYFFWHGVNCTVNEKGASALMTMELDKEKGPQVRVVQGKEPAAFYSLFNGGMIILNGKSETDSLESKNKEVRMFCVRTQVKNEACLVEVKSDNEKQPFSANLRSRGCYVIYHVTASKLFLWVGSCCTKSLKKSGTLAARLLKKRLHRVELILTNEGKEPNDLWNLLGSKESYVSLLNDIKKFDYTPRLFEFTSSIGHFNAQEIVFPARNGEVEAFPFDQSDLYSATQPAIFLMDNWTELYVWFGWWPEEKNKLLREANVITGSSHSRLLRDKKLAMQTAQQYVKACKRVRTPKTYVIHAGMEHERFKNLFPYWEDIQELNCKGKIYPKRLDLEGELQKYSKTQFSLEELKQKPPPEGVDPAKLEVYLSDEDFKRLFEVDKSEFKKMPLWKQTNQKKAVGLF